MKCNCNTCSGHLEFDPAHVGMAIQCPLCGMETVLYEPTTSPAATPPTEETKPQKTASIVKGAYTVGDTVERKLDSAGSILLGLGIAGAVIGLIAGIVLLANLDSERSASPAVMCFAFAIACFLQGYVFCVFFRGMAEMVRLLKKANGIKYSDKITEAATLTRWQCSRCSTPVVVANQKKCPECGSKFTATKE